MCVFHENILVVLILPALMQYQKHEQACQRIRHVQYTISIIYVPMIHKYFEYCRAYYSESTVLGDQLAFSFNDHVTRTSCELIVITVVEIATC